MDIVDQDTILDLCDEDAERSIQALHEYLGKHVLPLQNWIKKLLHQHGITYNVDEMAEEILQILCVNLLKRAADYSLLEVESLTGYVYRAARYATSYYLRPRKNKDVIPESETFWETSDRILQEEGMKPSETQELEKALFFCIELLPDLQKKYINILAADYDDPLSPNEIAALNNVAPASVRNRLFEARKSLEQCLKAKGFNIPKKGTLED